MQEKVLKINKSVLYQDQNKKNQDDLFFSYQAPRITLTQINEQTIRKNKQQKQPQKQQEIIQVNQKTQPTDLQSTKQIRLKLIHSEGQLRRTKQKYQAMIQQKNFVQQQLKRLKKNFVQLQKNSQELNKKLFQLEEFNHHQAISLSQKETLQNKIRHLEIEKRQFQLRAYTLQIKQEQLDKLQINHQALNFKCQNLIQTNKEYEEQVQYLKNYIREFQDGFYRRKLKKVLPIEIRDFLSETQQKMGKIDKMIDQLQMNYYKEQEKMFQRQKNHVIIQYGKLAKQKAEDINKKIQISIETRQNLIKQCKKQLQLEQKIKVKAIEKKILDYKNKIHDKKMAKKSKMLKQRVADIQRKIFSLSNSQFITRQQEKTTKNTTENEKSQSNNENLQINRLKQTLSNKELQLNYLKKVATNTLFQGREGPQTYKIKISMEKQSDIKDGKNNEKQTSSIYGSPYRYGVGGGNLSFIRPQINSKTNTYEDGTKIPQLQDLLIMIMEIEVGRKKIKMFETQTKQLKQQCERLFSKNQKIYEQLQNTKMMHFQSSNKLQQLKNARYAKIQRLQTQLSTQESYYLNLVEQKNNAIACLQNQTTSLRERCLVLAKNQTFLFASAKMLKQQLRFNTSNLTSQMGVQNVKNIVKMQDCRSQIILLQQKIQQQSRLLQNYLGQNLQLTIKLQYNQKKLKQFQEKINNQAQLIIQKQSELISNKNDNLLKSNNYKNSIIVLEKRISKLIEEDNIKNQTIKENKQQIKTLKKQNKKYITKIESLKEEHQLKIQKVQKKYKKLQKKYFGLESVQSSQKNNKKQQKNAKLQIQNDSRQINKNQSNSNLHSKEEFENSYKLSQLSESIKKSMSKQQNQQFFDQNSSIMSISSVGSVQKQNSLIHFLKDKIK